LRDLIEWPTASAANRILARERLPSANSQVDEAGLDIKPDKAPANPLGCEQGRPRS